MREDRPDVEIGPDGRPVLVVGGITATILAKAILARAMAERLERQEGGSSWHTPSAATSRVIHQEEAET